MHNEIVQNIVGGLLERKKSESFINSIRNCLNEMIFNINHYPGYWHPLGFVKYTIMDWTSSVKLRLHIWPDWDRRGNLKKNWIHNHEYDINSFILCGKLFNKTYKLCIEGECKQYRVFRVAYNESKSDLITTNNFYDIAYEKTYELYQGSFYTINKWDFHVSDVPQGQIVSTILINTEKEETSPEVLGEFKLNNQRYNYKREICEKSYSKELISKVLYSISL